MLHVRQGADSSGRSGQSSHFPAVDSDGYLSPSFARFLKLCRGGGTHTPTHSLEPEGTALSHEDAEQQEVKTQALVALTEWSYGRLKVLLGFSLAFSPHQGLLALTGHSPLLGSLVGCLRASLCCGQTAFPGHGTCSPVLVCC